VAKLVDLDKRLRGLIKKVAEIEERVDVIETNSINYHNRLCDLEDDDDD
jgi:hypothetical protein